MISLNAEALGAAGTSSSVEGGELTLAADGTMVNDANVICSDVPVANGTVHIVDSVPLPQVALDAIAAMDSAGDEMSGDAMMGGTGEACGAVPADGEGSFTGMADDTAATAASNNPLLSTLVSAVTEAGLVDTLNDAFAALPPADLEAALADVDMLTQILTLHVVAGDLLSLLSCPPRRRACRSAIPGEQPSTSS